MEEKIKKLSNKLANKKVVFYCISKLFDDIWEKYNLTGLFNIEALCDIKFKNEEIYQGIKCIPPSHLKKIDFDCLIIVSPDFDTKEKYLKENNLIDKKIKILNLAPKKEKLNIKKNYQKILNNLKTKEKIKILFICEQNEKWCYTDLYNKLKNNPKFEILPVVLFPIISKGEIIFTQNENIKFFNKLNIKTIDGFDYENQQNINIKNLEPDIVFYQQPWYLNNLNNPKFVSNYALTIMAPYGYTTLSEKEWGSNSTKEVYQNLWLFLAESPYHINFYKKAAKMKDNLIALGSLKLDNYLKPIKDNIFKKNENPKIIYAPHHSIGKDGLRMSTFRQNYQSFLNFAKNNSQYSFIYKPHPMLEVAVVEHNLMTKEEYQNYVNEWENLENSKVYNKGEYFDIFKSSDILITDCSSFLAEYFPSKKPIIFLNRADRAPFDKFGNKIKKGFYEINDFNKIPKLLNKILIKKEDKLTKKREEIINKYFYMEGSTCEKFIYFLESLLTKE